MPAPEPAWPWLARSAQVHGPRPALSTPAGPSLDYSVLLKRARAAAGGLSQRGIEPGARVGLRLGGEELIVALHACTMIGAEAVPIDLRLGAGERALRSRGAALVLDELGSGPPAEISRRTPEETATVMFTSGTTAGPKEVQLSYQNWLWAALGSAMALGLDPDERWLCPMPLAHVGGLGVAIRSAIYGTEVLVHERFETGAVLSALMEATERVTLVSLVPTMLSRLLDAGLRKPPMLRWALLGGGPITPALLARAREAEVPVASSYGMTEACSQIATAGWPLLGVELRIAGASAGGAEPEVGEVLVRGQTVARGALGPDGWLHTGDLGRFDPDGRLVIEGRLADTIITGGENVSPAEVEAALLDHPAVADAAVLGRADPEWGDAVVAQVVLRGAGPGAEELRAHCAARLAPFKVPKRFEAVASVPRGSTGKLLRRELA